MKTADNIDGFLRENLINWALEDMENPIKRATLHALSKENWLELLYSTEEPQEEAKEEVKTELPAYIPIHQMTKEQIGALMAKKPSRREALGLPPKDPESIEEEWKKELLKAVFYALKKAYGDRFEVSKWAMQRVNTTGMYILGPVNHYNDIFFKFKIGIKDNFFYWDLENRHGKIRPKGFEAIPRVILEVLEKFEYDMIIRKISKGFGIMLYSGETSKALLKLLLALKEEHVRIGNDAHGNLWIQENKKKRFGLFAHTKGSIPLWCILEKETGESLACFSTTEQMHSCMDTLNLPKTHLPKKQLD